MQPKSKKLLTLAALLIVALVVYLLATAPLPPANEQIANQMKSIAVAVESRSTSGVMAVASPDYRDAQAATLDQLHSRLLYVFRNSGSVQVHATEPAITVTGSTAVSVNHVSVTASQGPTHFTCTLTLHWKREPTRRFLVFPSSVWHVTSAEYPDAAVGMGN